MRDWRPGARFVSQTTYHDTEHRHAESNLQLPLRGHFVDGVGDGEQLCSKNNYTGQFHHGGWHLNAGRIMTVECEFDSWYYEN